MLGMVLTALLPTAIGMIKTAVAKKAPELSEALEGKIVSVEEGGQDRLRANLDDLLDFVENAVFASENKLDDKLLYVTNFIRTAYDIPDDIYGDED